ncbi:MAG: hypothetical protein ACJ73S_15885 [Mycobacteriales bacterium]
MSHGVLALDFSFHTKDSTVIGEAIRHVCLDEDSGDLASDEVGGYQWTRTGFDFGNQDSLRRAVVKAFAELDRRDALTTEGRHDGETLKRYLPDDQADPDDEADPGDPVRRDGPAFDQADLTPFELGRIGLRGRRRTPDGRWTWDGKEVMLGVPWTGFKDLVPPDQELRIFMRKTQPLAGPAGGGTPGDPAAKDEDKEGNDG